MKTPEINRETFVSLQVAVGGLFGRLPRIILVDHVRITKLLCILILFMAAVYMVVSLLYLTPEDVAVAEPREVTLQTSVIDELEVWLEERQDNRQQDIMPGSANYFVRP